METVLTERGQTSVPAQVRKRMRLSPGAKLRWQEISEGECRVTARRAEPGPGAVAMLGYAKQFRKTRLTREWMRELRRGDRT
jgi:bifunctional DNA-binding transcriptional regulator/antitoxin component of YhaV-PrlF toxin-antitoxin module